MNSPNPSQIRFDNSILLSTREKKSSEMVTFFVLQLSQTYIYIEIKEELKLNFQVR